MSSKNNKNYKKKTYLSPHDRYFRAILTNPKVITDFFKNTLPTSIQAMIDFNTIEPQKETFINDKLRLQITDLLYGVTIQGKPGYLYILVEHASKPDRLLPFRMLKYMTAIMDHHLTKTESSTLPVVYPLILYTGKQAFNYSLDLFDLFEENRSCARDIYKRPYQLVDLSHASDAVLAEYHWFRLAALLGKHIHDMNILPFLKETMVCLQELENNGELDYIYLSLSYIVEAGKVPDKHEFIQTITKGLTYVDEDKIMTIAELFSKEVFERGLEKGKAEGKQQGIAEEKLLIAKNMLANNISLDMIAKITGVPIKTLKNFKH